eukprot:gene31476-biopygen6335
MHKDLHPYAPFAASEDMGADTCFTNNPANAGPTWHPKSIQRYDIWSAALLRDGFAAPPAFNVLKAGTPYFRTLQGRQRPPQLPNTRNQGGNQGPQGHTQGYQVGAIRQEFTRLTAGAQRPSHPHDTHIRDNQPLRIEAAPPANNGPPEPDWYSPAMVVSFAQAPGTLTKAQSQAMYTPTYNPATSGPGSTTAIPLPGAQQHNKTVTRAQHQATTTLLMDEITVLKKDMELVLREIQNLHEFNRALQVRATAMETAQRACTVLSLVPEMAQLPQVQAAGPPAVLIRRHGPDGDGLAPVPTFVVEQLVDSSFDEEGEGNWSQLGVYATHLLPQDGQWLIAPVQEVHAHDDIQPIPVYDEATLTWTLSGVPPEEPQTRTHIRAPDNPRAWHNARVAIPDHPSSAVIHRLLHPRRGGIPGPRLKSTTEFDNPVWVHFDSAHQVQRQSCSVKAFYFANSSVVDETLAVRFFLLFAPELAALMREQNIVAQSVLNRDWDLRTVLDAYQLAVASRGYRRYGELDETNTPYTVNGATALHQVMQRRDLLASTVHYLLDNNPDHPMMAGNQPGRDPHPAFCLALLQTAATTLAAWVHMHPPRLPVYLRRLSYHFTRDSHFASNACDAVSDSRVWILNPMSEAATAAENAIRFSHTNWAYVYVILLMNMIEHGFSLDEYKYEVNRDGSLYSGCADTLYRELDGVENWTSIHTWGKEQARAQEEIHLLAADRDMARYHQNPAKPQQQLTPGTLYGEDVNPVNVYDLLPMPEPLNAETHPTRPPLSFEPSDRFFTVEEEERCCNQTRCTRLCGTPDISIHPSSIFVITPSALHQALPDIQPQYPDDWGNNNNSDEEVSTEPETTDTDEAEDDHCVDSDPQPAEIQDFFTNRFDDVDWRPGNDFFESQVLTYAAAPACVLPIGDPQGRSTPVGLPPAASLLPGRLQSLASCLNHMDPNFLQEGGINNSMPDGVVTPNPDRGAIHPDCDLFIGHHRDGTEAERSEMAAMLNKYTAAVARTMEDLREGYKGCVPPLDIKKDNDKQAFTSPYRKPPIEKLAQDKVCAELQMLHFIEPAPSAPHAANAVVALKKGPDGQYTANRVCYNYKAINLLTKDMHTGYPVAEELFQDLGDAQWFTRVDLRSGFYQVHLAEASQDFSAFWWDKQLYRFKRVPFGLKQAPAYFQKVMETELGKRGLLKFCKVFIDDILIHSATFAEHIRHVEAVLQCLIEVGLRIHPDKSCCALDAVDFLGFDVSNHGLTPQQAKVQAIKDLPYPANLKDLKTVLGKLRYYGCFCENISAIARPLNDLTKADVKWTWGPEQAAAMDKIRGLISTPGKVLRRFNVEARTLIHCDWSKHGLGAVLGQLDAEGLEYLVACASRSLNKHEAEYSSFKGEMLAACWACKIFRVYVLGLHFTLVTDHQPLLWMFSNSNVTGTIARWACMMQSFDFDIMHRPGAQHGNADALSRFPTPRQEDNTGARIDMDADLYAAFPAVPYITYNPLTLTLGCTVDAVLQVREVLSICTKPLPSAVAKMVQSGVTLYEMCGGLCAGLEATLRNGIRVNRYLYSDTAPAALTVARFRTQALLKLYPHLLQPYACDGAFTTLPQDVKAITPQHLMDAAVNDQTQWLIITGPECQDFSPAGSNRGLRGPRAAVLQACTTVIGYVQQLQHPAQPLYIIENAAMQHNFRSPAIANEDFTAVNMTIGQPICVDAATFNSVRRTANISANTFLDPGRSTTRVYRSDAPPFCLANKIGQPRTALPALVAYPLSRAFLPDKPGSIYSLQGGAWSEPRPDERERMLGYYTGATAAPGLTALQRHVLTGNCMDQRALVAIIRTSVELAAPPRLTALLAYQPPIRPQLLPASTPVLFLTTVPRFPHSSPAPSDDMPSHSRQFYGTELACMLAVTRNASAPRPIQPASPPPSAPPATPLIPTLAPGKQLDADIRLADMAKESEPLDIHDDQFVLEYLPRMVLGTNWSVARTRRVLARSRKYKLGFSPTGAEKIIRILANTMEPIVPAPSERATIIQRAHEASGHFGARRTAYLVVSSFWWQGVVKQVKALVKNCKVCDQALAYFNQPTATLQSHPIHGLFFAWGIDLSGPYIKTARGNTYLMHAIEYFSAVLVVVPIPAKEAAHTMYAHAHGVLAHYGTHAVAITDNGPEFLGKFKEHMMHNFIDHRTTHPNHPQGNGFVERSVGTIKAALTKICSEHLSTDTWDIDIAKVVMAYNCSPQETTKCAPFTASPCCTPELQS